MKKIVFLFCALASIGIFGCKKNSDSNTNNTTTDTTNTNPKDTTKKKDTTSNPTDTFKTKPYMPTLVTGSYWKFFHRLGDDSATATSDTFKLVVRANDSLIDGAKYKVLADSTDKYVYFLRKIADSSLRRGLFKNSGKGVIPDVEEKYLVDNVPVNYSWTNNIEVYNIPTKATYKILSLDDSLVVRNKKYYHVSRINLSITSSTIPNIGSGDFYYARGYGLIKYAFKASFSYFVLSFSTYEAAELMDSYIK